MIAAYTTAVLVVAASFVVGYPVWRRLDVPGGTWLAPATGFAALLVVANVAVRLPGEGLTALVAVVVLGVAGAVASWRAWKRPRRVAALGESIFVPVLALAAASVPFIVNGRFGVIGAARSNDFAVHLVWAEGLRALGHVPSFASYPGYPLAPHALAAAFGEPGHNVEGPLVGVLMAVPALAAITTVAALRDLRPVWRFPAALAVALPYLVASYFAQSAFKELILALFVLALALSLRAIIRAERTNRLAGVPIGIVAAGAISTYSYPALPWIGAALAAVVLARVVLRGPGPWRAWTATAAVAAAVFLVGSAFEIARFHDFASTPVADVGVRHGHPGGNLFGPVPGREVLGVWFSSDFRLAPGTRLERALLPAGALLALVLAAVWWIRRRELELPAAAAAGLALWAVSTEVARPYLSAKALVVCAPLVALVAAGGLLAEVPDRPRGGALARAVVAGLLLAAMAWSSALALRGAPVGPRSHAAELNGIEASLHGKPTLFLGNDDYSSWELSSVPLGTVYHYRPVEAAIATPVRRQKLLDPLGRIRGAGVGTEVLLGTALDFDTVPTRALDRFRFAIAPRSRYGSVPPPNWRPVSTTRSYVLWRREGPTPPHSILPAERQPPGARLDCAQREGKRIGRERGEAIVRRPPVTLPAARWRGAGRPAPDGSARLGEGRAASQRLTLPRGRWELSLQYRSPAPLRIRAGSLRTALPATLDDTGPYWAAGTLISPGRPVELSASTPKPPRVRVAGEVSIGNVAATRVGDRARIVPLRRACGRYVDWFRVR